jgi:hypothetical protein
MRLSIILFNNKHHFLECCFSPSPPIHHIDQFHYSHLILFVDVKLHKNFNNKGELLGIVRTNERERKSFDSPNWLGRNQDDDQVRKRKSYDDDYYLIDESDKI